jgi:hypothetical protein
MPAIRACIMGQYTNCDRNRGTLYIWKINAVDECKGIDNSECWQESEIYLSNNATGFLVILFERRRCLS